MCPKKMASLILLINFVLDTSFLPAQESLVIKVINMSVAYDLFLKLYLGWRVNYIWEGSCNED